MVAALAKLGYVVDRQRGSHIVLRQVAAPHRRLTVPDHNEIAKGTLRAIIKQAGLTVAELIRVLITSALAFVRGRCASLLRANNAFASGLDVRGGE